jgi:fatty acid desaturase
MTTTPADRTWIDALGRDEIARLLEFRDWRSWLSLLVDWGLIGASFALVALLPNVLTIVFAVVVIGGRQLGLAVLMHESSHRSLFRDRRVNDWVGNWLCGYPVWSDMRPYRKYHLQHHAKTGTADDPDLGLAAPFPVTRASLRRKVWRDLSGRTGIKRAVATWRRDLGMSRGRVARGEDAGVRSLTGVLVSNGVLFAILLAVGHPALYLLWVAAWLTTYSLVMRIRSIGEHGMVGPAENDLQNTRTTVVRWWERFLLAPNRVNFHLEHHLLMTVPHYNLPRMHRLLRERGVLADACIAYGYPSVLRLASSRSPAESVGSATGARPPVHFPPF